MTTQVLIINPQLAFTVALKQALERTGSFDVHPFTTADAAIEYLQDHPQDVALVQASAPGADLSTLILDLRAIQPDLPIVISPQQPAPLLQRLDVQGSINTPFTARDVIPLLNAAAEARGTVGRIAPPPVAPPGATQSFDDLPDEFIITTRFDDTGESASSLYDASIFDLDLDQIAQPDVTSEDTPSKSPSTRNFDELIRSSRGDESRKPLHERTQSLIDFTLPGTGELDRPRDPAESTRMFRRLADEEPPMPALEDEGTVGDLMNGVADTGFRDVLAILRGDQPAPDAEQGGVPSLSDDELQSVLASFYEAEDDDSGDPVDDFSYEPPGHEGRSTARVILETAFDESTPPDQFSLDDLIASIERQLPEHRPNVQPLPSWLRDTEPVVAEPDFLPEEPARVLPLDFTGDLYDQTTRPSSRQHIETRAGEMETEMLEPVARTQPTDVPDFPDVAPFDGDSIPEEEWAALFAEPAPSTADVPAFADEWVAPSDEVADEVTDEEWASVFDDVAQDTSAPVEHADEAPMTDEPLIRPLEGMPEDLDASFEPLLMEKFSGAWDDSAAVEAVDAEPDTWLADELSAWEAQDSVEATVPSAAVTPFDADAHDAVDSWDDVPAAEAAEPTDADTFADDWEAVEALDASELTWFDDGIPVGMDDAMPDAEPLTEEDALDSLGPWPVVEAEAEDDVAPVAEAPSDDDERTREDVWGAYIQSLPETIPDAPAEESPVHLGERLPELPVLELPEFDTSLFDTQFEQLAAFDFPDAEVLQLQPQTGARPVDDPRIAQIALSLTHASLESTAEATLLTRHGEIIGFAGELTREDLEELQHLVSQWDHDLKQAHFGFVTLASTGRVVMVYTCRTVGDLSLSMIFAGSTPLRDIRRQGKRMVEALESTPEPEVALQDYAPIVELQRASEAMVEEPADVGPLVAQGALWVLADPNATLDDDLAEALTAGMQMQLDEARWRVHAVEARDEYVYVFADMPAERPQAELVDELKRRASAIVAAVDPTAATDTLWADGYMVVTPGRLLEQDEIQDYVNFERA